MPEKASKTIRELPSQALLGLATGAESSQIASASTQSSLPGLGERPDVVDARQRIGDWEVDTILGQGRQQAIVTLNERKSRLALLQKVERRSADRVAQAILEQLRPFADVAHTLTSDNGKEFAQHETVAEELDLDFYFAHPYASWERGANENMNGLVRQYLPKQSDFTNVSQADLETIMCKLNHRPRKCLDFRSPFQVFFQQAVALGS